MDHLTSSLVDVLSLAQFGRWLVFADYMLGIEQDDATRIAFAPPGTPEHERAVAAFDAWTQFTEGFEHGPR